MCSFSSGALNYNMLEFIKQLLGGWGWGEDFRMMMMMMDNCSWPSIRTIVFMEPWSKCTGRTVKITWTPALVPIKLHSLETRGAPSCTPLHPAPPCSALVIDFLPRLDLSVVGSRFNLAINWESSSRMSYSIFFLSGWGICFMMHCVLNTSNLGKWLLRGPLRLWSRIWSSLSCFFFFFTMRKFLGKKTKRGKAHRIFASWGSDLLDETRASLVERSCTPLIGQERAWSTEWNFFLI